MSQCPRAARVDVRRGREKPDKQQAEHDERHPAVRPERAGHRRRHPRRCELTRDRADVLGLRKEEVETREVVTPVAVARASRKVVDDPRKRCETRRVVEIERDQRMEDSRCAREDVAVELCSEGVATMLRHSNVEQRRCSGRGKDPPPTMTQIRGSPQ